MLGSHDVIGFRTSQLPLWEVDVDLISIKISIECVAVAVMHTNRLTLRLQDTGSQRHDRRLVKSGLTIHQQNITFQQVTPHTFHPHIPTIVLSHQHLGQSLALTSVLVLQVNEESLIILDIAGSWIGITTIHYQLTQFLHIVSCHWLGIAQLTSKS